MGGPPLKGAQTLKPNLLLLTQALKPNLLLLAPNPSLPGQIR